VKWNESPSLARLLRIQFEIAREKRDIVTSYLRYSDDTYRITGTYQLPPRTTDGIL